MTTNLNYRILRDVRGFSVTYRTSLFGLNEWDEVTPIGAAQPQDNDLVVTDNSSRHPAEKAHSGPYNRNHSTLKDSATIRDVVARIRSDFPVR